jgi:hypothetical protein
LINLISAKEKSQSDRGAGSKVPVFCLLKGGGKVFAEIIPDAKRSTLIPLILE